MYYDNISWMSVEAMSQLKSSKKKALRAVLNFYVVLATHNNRNLFGEVFINTTMRFGSISAVNKQKV